MLKQVDKLLLKIKFNKKVLVFLLGLLIIGIISGSIFVIILDKNDKTIITNYLAQTMETILNNKLDLFQRWQNSLISHLFLFIGVWLLGISVIGIPIVLFLYFSECFSLGFLLASFILNYKIKGLALSLAYILPNYLLFLSILIIMVSYSLILSNKLINSVIKKKQIDFKMISTKYFVILLISLLVVIICSLYEGFVIPMIIKWIF